jgi:hypothetical protein
MTVPEPYLPSVNESETITDAQRTRGALGHGTKRFPVVRLESPVLHCIERS